jgi:hypothetical protein
MAEVLLRMGQQATQSTFDSGTGRSDMSHFLDAVFLRKKVASLPITVG